MRIPLLVVSSFRSRFQNEKCWKQINVKAIRCLTIVIAIYFDKLNVIRSILFRKIIYNSIPCVQKLLTIAAVRYEKVYDNILSLITRFIDKFLKIVSRFCQGTFSVMPPVHILLYCSTKTAIIYFII